MSLKKETETKNKITLKGIVTSVGETEMEVEDEKDSSVDTFKLTDLEMFVGKSINLTVCDTVKKEITEETVEN